MTENFIKRLQHYMEVKGINDNQMTVAAGLSVGLLGKLKKSGKGMNSTNIEKILLSYPDLSPTWLLTGKGDMFRESDTQLATPTVQSKFPLSTDRLVAQQSIPLYELDATAGLVSLFDTATHHSPISYLQIPDLPPCDGALYVRGDSMYPLLKSGDIVLYKEVPNLAAGIIWGEMYLLSFVLDGESYITIKYIQKADNDKFVRLVSYNPHFSPQDILADSIRALALIKASIRFNTMG